jgi:hypothetical protein
LLGWQDRSVKVDVGDAQIKDSANLRMAQAISLLPVKLRSPVLILIRSLGQLSASDLK